MSKTILSIGAVLVILISPALEAGCYVEQAVTRIELGTEEHQLGVDWVDEEINREGNRPEGVQGLAVDNAGNLYFGDCINGKVKKYSHTGKFLGATEGWLVNFQCFTIDVQGRIIARDYGLEGPRVIKYDSSGKQLWARTFHEVVSGKEADAIKKELGADSTPRFDGKVTTGMGNEVIAELRAVDAETRKPIRAGLRLDENGRMAGIFPRFGLATNDSWLSFNTEKAKEINGSVRQSVSIVFHKVDGKTAKQHQLDIRLDEGPHYAGVKVISDVLPDRQGGFFTCCHAEAATPIVISKHAAISRDIVLNQYDGNAKHIGHLRVPGSPFDRIASSVAIAPNGDIYHLRFDKTGVDVIRHSRSKSL